MRRAVYLAGLLCCIARVALGQTSFSASLSPEDRSFFVSKIYALVQQHFINQSITINSGYRTPLVQQSIPGGSAHPQDRHVHGDAANIASNQTTWQALHDAGKAAEACVEPTSVQGNSYGHVHVDWRAVDHESWPAGCPVGRKFRQCDMGLGTFAINVVFASMVLLTSTTILAGPQAHPSEPGTAELLANLKSRDWTIRADAYYKLSKEPAALHDEQVKTALIDLLDYEDHLSPSYKPRDSEEYGEYISDLVGTAASIIDWEDPRELCIMAHSPFDPDSELARRLAETGEPVVPCLLRMANSDAWIDRYQSVAVLIQVRAKVGNLTSKTVREIRDLTLRALRDPQDMVRAGTVHALANFGIEDMVPALKRVAETDPGPEVQGHSIRKEAAAAIASIQKRADQRKP